MKNFKELEKIMETGTPQQKQIAKMVYGKGGREPMSKTEFLSKMAISLGKDVAADPDDINSKLKEFEEIYDNIFSISGASEKIPEGFKGTLEQWNELKLSNENVYDFLYPNLNDANFNIKISERKEFNDTKYDGNIVLDIEKHSQQLCNADFELAPHQMFVRNFLSFQTPYNSLLLYHGLGTGKTCSSIGVCEEMREYMKQVAINQRIIIVASPTVQEEFKKQLFNEEAYKRFNDFNKLNIEDNYYYDDNK